jgi:hypothetical protein
MNKATMRHSINSLSRIRILNRKDTTSIRTNLMLIINSKSHSPERSNKGTQEVIIANPKVRIQNLRHMKRMRTSNNTSRTMNRQRDKTKNNMISKIAKVMAMNKMKCKREINKIMVNTANILKVKAEILQLTSPKTQKAMTKVSQKSMEKILLRNSSNSAVVINRGL